VRYLKSLTSAPEAVVVSNISASFAMYGERVRGHRPPTNSNSMYLQDLLLNGSGEYDPTLKVCHTERQRRPFDPDPNRWYSLTISGEDDGIFRNPSIEKMRRKEQASAVRKG